ncbi:hypothetical protein LJR066_006680 [Acidovorax sp. LjRoot66]|uniref:hypothetical protein n=1 Tax=Acidovorax sp. LjRoot66 TaxID=3342334 RepID=UPI003ECD2E8E
MTEEISTSPDGTVTLTPKGLRILKLTWATALFGAGATEETQYPSLDAAKTAVDLMLAGVLEADGTVATAADATMGTTLRH